MEQQPEAIVLEVAHPVPDPAQLFSDQILRLGGTVGDAGHVVVEDLFLPGRDGLGQPGELGDISLGCVLVESDQLPTGGVQVLGGVHLTQQLLAEDPGPTLAVGVALVEGDE